ncbi:MAG: class I SAM-dependent DNA methyltransferase, partial [Desulfobulbaceae bacterium]|nr:class I SAM-dependent DNA methyltransferase [Desulfobulbaceae bacterium]
MTDDNSANNPVPNFYRASAANFKKIPGSPIAYWFSKNAAHNCESSPILKKYSDAKSGMSSCNSNLFLRQWHEVSFAKIIRSALNHDDTKTSLAKWYPYNKGGGNRRWYGYNDTVINWKNEGEEIKYFVTHNPKDPDTTHWSRRLFNLEYFFKHGLTWSAVTSGRFSCRKVLKGVIPGTGSKTLYDLDNRQQEIILTLMNTVVSSYYLLVFSPTLNFEAGDVVKLPVIESISPNLVHADTLVNVSKSDWDSYETSWDFTTFPPLQSDYYQPTLQATYSKLRANWLETTLEMQRMEEENNRIFIEAYGLQDELTPEVPLSEITLTCNPHYRYNGNKSEEELEALLLTDTIKEFISYAVGCMFGRYSLDKPGLILANQGETIKDYLQQVPEPSFMPDDDNIIPILEDEYFTDDIVSRFREFLKATFGAESLAGNLEFIAGALSKSKKGGGSPEKVIR